VGDELAFLTVVINDEALDGARVTEIELDRRVAHFPKRFAMLLFPVHREHLDLGILGRVIAHLGKDLPAAANVSSIN
jgi:hypothetical protein